MGVLEVVTKIGDVTSGYTENAIKFIANYGVQVTPIQSKIFLIIFFGFLIYLFSSLIIIARKILKYSIIILLIILEISILISIFK